MAKVAILISTRDRPDFMNRQLSYYAKLGSPHPIYIADSSNKENTVHLKNAIDKFKNKLSIKYAWYPPGPDNHRSLLEQVEEKYACVISDDDYQIPPSLTKCAQFLENSPDYAAAGGYSVSFRLKKSGPYGELARLADYPRHSIESDTARQRFLDFMKVIYSISFFVNRVDNMKKAWDNNLYMAQSMNELISWNNLIIPGKSKLLDCLSLVRQIHDQQYSITNSFTWITSKNFADDYDIFKKIIATAISEKDNIGIESAEEAVKEAFWQYILNVLSYDYKFYLAPKHPATKKLKKDIRIKIGQSFPLLKKVYRNYLRPFLSKNLQLHHEVLQSGSKFYQDFKPILDSFTGKDLV